MRLEGWRIALTGAAGRDEEIASAIEEAGGRALRFPLIAFEPAGIDGALGSALAQLESHDWIVLTSATAATLLGAILGSRRAGVPPIAVVGPATARAAAAHLAAPAFVASRHTARDLAAELITAGVTGRVLIPAADIAGPELADALRRSGVQVQQVVAYRTLSGPGGPALAEAVMQGSVDVVLLASPSAVRSLLAARQAPGAASSVPVVCIGPSTAGAARSAGLDVVAVAVAHDRRGLLAALSEWARLHPEGRHESIR